MRYLNKLSVPWAIVIAGVLVAAGVYFSGPDKAALFTNIVAAVSAVFLAVLTGLLARSQRRTEWFMGAMERHSDQQRQIAAMQAGVRLVWWDKTEPAAMNAFPFEGKHGEEFKLDTLYVGIPLEFRRNPTPAWAKLVLGDR